MHVKIEIPELKEYLRGFPQYWLNVTLLGNRPESHQVNAITTTYVRLVEGALTEYRQARSLVFSFWNEHRSRLIPLSQVDQYLGLADRIRNRAGFDFFGRS